MTVLSLPSELNNALLKLAEVQHRSVGELVEDAVRQYVDELIAQVLSKSSDGEIAAVLEALAESDLEDAQGIEITLEEVEAELDKMIAAYQPGQTGV